MWRAGAEPALGTVDLQLGLVPGPCEDHVLTLTLTLTGNDSRDRFACGGMGGSMFMHRFWGFRVKQNGCQNTLCTLHGARRCLALQ